jgi:hypothetical protein
MISLIVRSRGNDALVESDKESEPGPISALRLAGLGATAAACQWQVIIEDAQSRVRFWAGRAVLADALRQGVRVASICRGCGKLPSRG